jgi:tetratricopeptide (TPR) repeat protein
VIDTPAYMAPEIYDGTPADASTDQFALGVTAFESLFRARPFSKEELQPPRATVPKPKIPEGTKVPARIQRAVMRMLSIDPAQRFPSVEAALAELAVDPFANRKRALIGGGVVALAGGAFALSMAIHSGPPPCTGIEQQLAQIWDADVKKQVREGFTGTKLSHALDSFAQLERALDAYSAQWTKTAFDSCRARRVAKTQTEEVLTLRQSCLDQRRDELRALTKLLVDPGRSLVEKSDKAVFELEPVESCNNVALLREPGRPPADKKKQVDELRLQLSDAKARVIAGQYLPALVASQKAIDLAKAIDYDPYLAEALVVRGVALTGTGNAADAAALNIEAAWVAIRARRDDIATSASLSAAMMVSDGLGRSGEAKLWAHLGEEFAHRTGLDKVPLLELRIHSVNGLVAAQAGDNTTAVAEHEKAFEAAQRLFGRESPGLWGDESILASTLFKALAYKRAIPHFEHSMALREKIVGRDNVEIAIMLSNLAGCYRHVGEIAKARAMFDQTIAIRQKLFGKNNPLLVAPLINYADLLKDNGEADKALPMIERAMKLAVPLPGIEHPEYHEAATTHAQVLAKLGRIPEARKELDDVIAIEQRVKSSVLATTQTARAEIELADHKWADAAAFAEQAITGFEAASGVENPELWRPLTRLAQAKLGAGDKAAAKPLLERAIAIGTKAGMGDLELEETRALRANL